MMILFTFLEKNKGTYRFDSLIDGKIVELADSSVMGFIKLGVNIGRAHSRGRRIDTPLVSNTYIIQY